MSHLSATVSAATLDDNALSVKWQDGRSFLFHPIWLRERLPNSDTVDPKSGQRLIEAALLPSDLKVEDVSCPDPEQIALRFSDGASGTFSANYLRQATEPSTDIDLQGQPKLWDASSVQPRLHSLPVLKADPAALVTLFNDLATNGFVIVEDVPCEKSGLLEFSGLIGNIKLTNWGGIEDIRVSPDVFDLSLSSRGLEPHVDNPYRFSSIGYVLLHCLENGAQGGESTVSDGFAAAERLRTESPETFDALTTTPVFFRYEDDQTILENIRPLIETDAEGRVRSVAYSNRTEFATHGPMERMERFYEARKRFAELLYSEEMTLELKLKPGQLAVFDNYRVLHGRHGYDASTGGRHMRQAYMDRDAVSGRQKALLRDTAGGNRSSGQTRDAAQLANA